MFLGQNLAIRVATEKATSVEVKDEDSESMKGHILVTTLTPAL